MIHRGKSPHGTEGVRSRGHGTQEHVSVQFHDDLILGRHAEEDLRTIRQCCELLEQHVTHLDDFHVRLEPEPATSTFRTRFSACSRKHSHLVACSMLSKLTPDIPKESVVTAASAPMKTARRRFTRRKDNLSIAKEVKKYVTPWSTGKLTPLSARRQYTIHSSFACEGRVEHQDLFAECVPHSTHLHIRPDHEGPEPGRQSHESCRDPQPTHRVH